MIVMAYFQPKSKASLKRYKIIKAKLIPHSNLNSLQKNQKRQTNLAK